MEKNPRSASDTVTQLEAGDTWLCHHVDAVCAPAAPTCLRLSDTHDWTCEVHNARRWLNCPDCGTRWRVWAELHKAKPTVYWHGRNPDAGAYRYRHAPIADIDHVIALVRQHRPLISVSQWEYVWPGDDDGLWFFGLTGQTNSIAQLESPFGFCPFVVDGAQVRTGVTVEETVGLVLEELDAWEFTF